MFLQYFDTVGWVFWPVKTVDRITYTVLVRVKPCSITHSLAVVFVYVKTAIEIIFRLQPLDTSAPPHSGHPSSGPSATLTPNHTLVTLMSVMSKVVVIASKWILSMRVMIAACQIGLVIVMLLSQFGWRCLFFALLAAAAKLVILRERISAACLLAGGTALSRAKMLRLIRYL